MYKLSPQERKNILCDYHILNLDLLHCVPVLCQGSHGHRPAHLQEAEEEDVGQLQDRGHGG